MKMMSLTNKEVIKELSQDAIEKDKQAKRVRYAFYMAKCSPLQKQIIEMHFFARPPQTFREIAQHLHLPLSKIYREYRRGLKILSSFFKENKEEV